MTICDSCKAPATEFVMLRIDAKDPKDCYEAKFDLCDKCAEFAHPNTFRIGMEALRNGMKKQEEWKREDRLKQAEVCHS